MKIGNSEYDYVFIGEKHGIKENFDIYFKYMNMLEKDKEKNIVLEIGYSAGAYINEYIHGNILYDIDEFIESYKNTTFYTNYFKEYILNLKKYVEEVNDIKVIGIDIEHQKDIASKVIQNIQDKDIKQNILENIKLAENIQKLDDLNYEIKREEYLYNNFVKYCKNKNTILFLGAYHIALKQEKGCNTKPLCCRIMENTNINFLSIEIKYTNTKRKIKIDNEFKIIDINDSFIENEYINLSEEIYLHKKNKKEAVILIKNGVEI